MSYKLIIEPAAEDDILEAFYWYEERLEGLGSRYLEELDSAFDRIISNPETYGEVEPGIRRSVTRTFPYLVFYAYDEATIHILAVLHAAQDPLYIADRIGA